MRQLGTMNLPPGRSKIRVVSREKPFPRHPRYGGWRCELNGMEFSILTDAVGTQIVGRAGRFFPEFRDFGSRKAALAYAREHEFELEVWLKDKKTKGTNDAMWGLAFAWAERRR